MAAQRIAAGPLARTLPDLWRGATPQGAGSYWPRVTDADRTLDFRAEVEAILRRVRAFGTIETLARVGDTRVFVAQAEGWREAHRHTPGTIVHRYAATSSSRPATLHPDQPLEPGAASEAVHLGR